MGQVKTILLNKDYTHNQINKLRKKPKTLVEEMFKHPSIQRSSGMTNDLLPIIALYLNQMGRSNYPLIKEVLFELIDLKVDVFESNVTVNAILNIVRHYNKRIRHIEDCVFNLRSTDRQLTFIIRHLFCKYPEVPKFMDKIWLSTWSHNSEVGISWFIYMGAGKNIRTIKNFPIKDYTKKMAHNFLLAPEESDNIYAVYWGYVMTLGGTKKLVDNVMDSIIVRDNFKNWDFWKTVIQFFINNPMLDPNQLNPICDYVKHMKYEHTRVGLTLAPPQMPNLSMKGRTAVALMRDVEDWHRKLSGSKRSNDTNLKWDTVGLDWFITFGKEEHKKVWSIYELNTKKELMAEGKELSHCVGSYANSCVKGDCAIFSMTLSEQGSSKKKVTIELNISKKKVVQVRGRANRRMDNQERTILEKWSAIKNIAIDTWVQ